MRKLFIRIDVTTFLITLVVFYLCPYALGLSFAVHKLSFILLLFVFPLSDLVFRLSVGFYLRRHAQQLGKETTVPAQTWKQKQDEVLLKLIPRGHAWFWALSLVLVLAAYAQSMLAEFQQLPSVLRAFENLSASTLNWIFILFYSLLIMLPWLVRAVQKWRMFLVSQ